MREITSHFAAYGKAVIAGAGRKADGGPAGLIDHMDVWTLPAAWRRLRADTVGSHRSPEPPTGLPGQSRCCFSARCGFGSPPSGRMRSAPLKARSPETSLPVSSDDPGLKQQTAC
jgi:hypothetical protein